VVAVCTYADLRHQPVGLADMYRRCRTTGWLPIAIRLCSTEATSSILASVQLQPAWYGLQSLVGDARECAHNSFRISWKEMLDSCVGIYPVTSARSRDVPMHLGFSLFLFERPYISSLLCTTSFLFTRAACVDGFLRI
jgi:hypothetical protein